MFNLDDTFGGVKNQSQKGKKGYLREDTAQSC